MYMLCTIIGMSILMGSVSQCVNSTKCICTVEATPSIKISINETFYCLLKSLSEKLRLL